MIECQRRALEDGMVPPAQQEYVPRPSADDRFEVRIYSRQHGRWIHRSFEPTRAAAARTRIAEEALGLRAGVRPIPTLDGGVAPGAVVRTVARTTPTPDPEIERGQAALRAAWRLLGEPERAMPRSMEKLRASLANAMARLPRPGALGAVGDGGSGSEGSSRNEEMNRGMAIGAVKG